MKAVTSSIVICLLLACSKTPAFASANEESLDKQPYVETLSMFPEDLNEIKKIEPKIRNFIYEFLSRENIPPLDSDFKLPLEDSYKIYMGYDLPAQQTTSESEILSSLNKNGYVYLLVFEHGGKYVYANISKGLPPGSHMDKSSKEFKDALSNAGKWDIDMAALTIDNMHFPRIAIETLNKNSLKAQKIYLVAGIPIIRYVASIIVNDAKAEYFIPHCEIASKFDPWELTPLSAGSGRNIYSFDSVNEAVSRLDASNNPTENLTQPSTLLSAAPAREKESVVSIQLIVLTGIVILSLLIAAWKKIWRQSRTL